MLTVVIMDLDLPNAKSQVEKALVAQAYRLFPTDAGAAKALNVNEAELHYLSLKHNIKRPDHAKHSTDFGVGSSVVAPAGNVRRLPMRELDGQTNQVPVLLALDH